MYRTGDLVRESDDGNLLYLGRRDAQIKRSGNRIELGDIESTLNTLEDVLECAVVALPDELISNRVKAFVVAREDVTAANLMAHCARLLPSYMIPDSIELRDALPKSSTGKVDRRLLLTLEEDSHPDHRPD